MDNSPSAKDTGYIWENYPWVKVITMNRNVGATKARNLGAEAAKGEFVVFLDNDTVVTPDWLNGLVDAMQKDKNIGVAGGKILCLNEPNKINSAGGIITFIGVGYDLGFFDNNSEHYNIRGSRGYLCGAVTIVRRDEFLSFGGFDEDYFIYLDDTDICWRYWLYGKRVEYIPDSVIYHKCAVMSGIFINTPLKVFYGTRNPLFNIIKNYAIHNILLALFFLFHYHLFKILYFLIKLDLGAALSMIKAYCSFFKYLPKTVVKRKEIQSNRKVKDSYLLNKSIIISLCNSFKVFLRIIKN